ncbi:MAG TPA: hypothetical protein VGN75_16140, partial [Kaistia sp.]|nr:hypothetical protein [Kaistia sp.]
MAQYKTGTVTVINGSNLVAGEGTAWLANARIGDLFTVAGSNLWYSIASIDADGSLALDNPWSGETKAGAAYAVHRDFTPVYSLPYPQHGDIDPAGLWKRAVMTIETALKGADGTLALPINVDEGGTGTQALMNQAVVFGSGVSALRSVLLAKGEILIGQGSAAAPLALAVGTDGRILVADSTTTTGVKWGQVPAPLSIHGVRNDGGDIAFDTGGAVTITADDATNTITFAETHSARTNNPHAVTKAQVGLGNVLDAVQLVATNNLSELTASAETARTNLGLGSMATQFKSAAEITGGTIAGLTSLEMNGPFTLANAQALRSKNSSGVVHALFQLSADDTFHLGNGLYPLVLSGASLLVNPSASFLGNVSITGDLTVQGTVNAVSSDEVNIGDSVIVLNADEAGTPSQDAGVEVERGTSNNARFVWREDIDAFAPQLWDGSAWARSYLAAPLAPTQDSHVGDRAYNDARYAQLSGATFTGSVTATSFLGNASTATKLATARTINGTPFDGTTNISIQDGTKLDLIGGTLSGVLTVQTGGNNQAIVIDATTAAADAGISVKNPTRTWSAAVRGGLSDSYVIRNITDSLDVLELTTAGVAKVKGKSVYTADNVANLGGTGTNIGTMLSIGSAAMFARRIRSTTPAYL